MKCNIVSILNWLHCYIFCSFPVLIVTCINITKITQPKVPRSRIKKAKCSGFLSLKVRPSERFAIFVKEPRKSLAMQSKSRLSQGLPGGKNYLFISMHTFWRMFNPFLCTFINVHVHCMDQFPSTRLHKLRIFHSFAELMNRLQDRMTPRKPLLETLSQIPAVNLSHKLTFNLLLEYWDQFHLQAAREPAE